MDKELIIETPDGNIIGTFEKAKLEEDTRDQHVAHRTFTIITDKKLRWESDGSTVS